VWLFLLLALACGQGAKIVAEGALFASVRGLVRFWSPFLGDGVSCLLCVSTWGGLILASFVQFSGIAPSFVGWLVDGLALALVGRALVLVPDIFIALHDRLK